MHNIDLNKEIAKMLGFKAKLKSVEHGDGYQEEIVWITPPEFVEMGVLKFNNHVPDFVEIIRTMAMHAAVHHNGKLKVDKLGAALFEDLDVTERMVYKLWTLRSRKVGGLVVCGANNHASRSASQKGG